MINMQYLYGEKKDSKCEFKGHPGPEMHEGIPKSIDYIAGDNLSTSVIMLNYDDDTFVLQVPDSIYYDSAINELMSDLNTGDLSTYSITHFE